MTARNPKLRDLAWLGLALALHSVLLLIDVSIPTATDSARQLAVTIAWRPPQATPPEPEAPVEESAPVPEPVPPPQSAASAAPQAVREPEIAAIQKEAKETPAVTTAILLHSASRTKWAAPKPDSTRSLGILRPRPLPENWRASIIEEDNLFDGMTVPAETEIVDLWLAADGSRNVVVNTRTGHTLCGQARAWDPMRPLVEHVMMVRNCGGGKRSFEMPHRGQRPRDIFE